VMHGRSSSLPSFVLTALARAPVAHCLRAIGWDCTAGLNAACDVGNRYAGVRAGEARVQVDDLGSDLVGLGRIFPIQHQRYRGARNFQIVRYALIAARMLGCGFLQELYPEYIERVHL
jgi:hypothetical protein